MKKLKYFFNKQNAKKLTKEHAGYEREKFEDRNVLEEIIFPYILAYHNPKKILDIGREDYQAFYNFFFEGRELWTLDFDPIKKEFGSNNHITDNVTNLKKHFQNNYFDFILMNGVFGWGLNKKADVEKTFLAIYDILAPNGIFILGYNDAIFPLSKIPGLKKLKPYDFKPLGGKKFKCINGEHKYNFYIKK